MTIRRRRRHRGRGETDARGASDDDNLLACELHVLSYRAKALPSRRLVALADAGLAAAETWQHSDIGVGRIEGCLAAAGARGRRRAGLVWHGRDRLDTGPALAFVKRAGRVLRSRGPAAGARRDCHARKPHALRSPVAPR